ncbi:putative bifunctional diguanylate cyclase/phosphodiesterase [Paenibacillus sp. 1001270B_150601_E10]|uniref:putative bifunctional diguanylate cyclase/phosphodiesterase n=1 Tax=Paenibacillus sp. 1001270B_150601_E10 TaxID=2787079 RepID=UPI00189F3922|nr:EAL domain-containing protein [Paenibacillus sp. 1001270B_150601_E10]
MLKRSYNWYLYLYILLFSCITFTADLFQLPMITIGLDLIIAPVLSIGLLTVLLFTHGGTGERDFVTKKQATSVIFLALIWSLIIFVVELAVLEHGLFGYHIENPHKFYSVTKALKVIFLLILTKKISSKMDNAVLWSEIAVIAAFSSITVMLLLKYQYYSLFSTLYILIDLYAIYIAFQLVLRFRSRLTKPVKILLTTSLIVCLILNVVEFKLPVAFINWSVHYILYVYYESSNIVLIAVLFMILKPQQPLAPSTDIQEKEYEEPYLLATTIKQIFPLFWLFASIYYGWQLQFDPLTGWSLFVSCFLVFVRQILVSIQDNQYLVRFFHLNNDFDGLLEERAEELLINEQRYQSLFVQLDEPLIILDSHGHILSCNPAYTQFLSQYYHEDDPDLPFIREEDQDFWVERFMRALEKEKQEFKIETTDRDGCTLHLDMKIVPYLLRNEVLGVYIIIQDQTAFVLNQERIHDLAYYDQLTHLPNRVMFYHEVENRLEVCPQAAVFFLDINRFKSINDTFGHEVGDYVLCEFARRVRGVLGNNGMVCRQSGDEFIIFLPSTEYKAAETLAMEIAEEIKIPMEYLSYRIRTGVSIGICMYPEEGATLTELISNADKAMYAAKQEGLTCYKFFNPELRSLVERDLMIEQGLRLCIDNMELFVYYQPKVNVKNDELIGVEGLLRWKHPTLGFVSPAEFIPIAEESGMIHALGDWVLESICQQLKRWDEEGIEIPTASMNVSLKQLEHMEYMERLLMTLQKYGIHPSRIELEITESIAMCDQDHILQTLNELHKHGLLLSMDDFGTGYASLSYITLYPLNTLKIDRSFIDAITASDQIKLVDIIISMAHQLGVEVIAEGVETHAQMEYLRARDCVMMQGYLFSKPLPACELTDWLYRYQASRELVDMNP